MLPVSRFCVMFLEVSFLHQQRSHLSSSFSLFVKTILRLVLLSLAEIEVNTHCCDWLTLSLRIHALFCSIYCVFWYSRCQVLWYSRYVWARVRSWGKRSWNNATTIISIVFFSVVNVFACLIAYFLVLLLFFILYEIYYYISYKMLHVCGYVLI